VVHRDLKPDNIRITLDETAKVLDFGLARADGSTTASGSATEFSDAATMTSPAALPGGASPTMPGVILGTAAYMSPEQARGRRVDKRTDIWSFGVVLYEMLAGGSPFAGETVSDSIGAVLHKDIDLTRLPDAAPAGVRQVLHRCLARDRDRRYHDIRDAVIDLESTERAEAPDRRAGTGLLLGIAAVTLLAGAAIGWFGSGASAPAVSTPAGQVRLSIPMPDGHEVVGSIALSPNGKTVAFTAVDQVGNRNLFLRDLDSFESRMVPRSRDADAPFFSPDSASVAFFAGGALRRAPVDGGGPIPLSETEVTVGGCWLPNGEIVFGTGTGSGLKRVREDGTPLEPLLPLPEDSADYAYVWPQLIPGTNQLLYTAWVSRNGGEFGTAGARILDLETGASRAFGSGRSQRFVAPVRWSASGHAIFESWEQGLRVTSFDPTSGELPAEASAVQLLSDVADLGNATRSVFDLSANGTLAYVPRADQTSRLVWVDPDGSVEVVIESVDLEEFANLTGSIDLSPDGRRALVGGGGNVVEIDLRRGLPTPLTRVGNNLRPFYIGESGRIGFTSNREQGWGLWTKSPGADAELEFLGGAFIYDADDVPGGGFIYVDDRDIYTADADGNTAPLIATPAEERSPAVSPDGRWVAYQSNASGSREIYVVPLDRSRPPGRVTTSGGQAPQWSDDGSSLYYRRGRSVMRVSMDGASPVGDPESVFPAEYLERGTGYAVNADGSRMLAIQGSADALQDEIRIITNFFDEIERVTGSRE